jgi:hypothetical protein
MIQNLETTNDNRANQILQNLRMTQEPKEFKITQVPQAKTKKPAVKI